jgi:hypothetical protein
MPPWSWMPLRVDVDADLRCVELRQRCEEADDLDGFFQLGFELAALRGADAAAREARAQRFDAVDQAASTIQQRTRRPGCGSPWS